MSLTRNGFQSFVNNDLPPGQLGARASMNPLAAVPGGERMYTADATDVVKVGNFAWFVPSTALAHGALAANAIIGFVSNELQALITDWLAQDNLSVNAGLPVVGYTRGDFWTKVGGTGVAVGQPVYATAGTGAPTNDDNSDANPDTGFIVASVLAVNAVTAATTTIEANTGLMTVATVNSGVIVAGQNITGTGVPANVFVTGQKSGTPGGAGIYYTTLIGAAAVAAFAATLSQGQLVKISHP